MKSLLSLFIFILFVSTINAAPYSKYEDLVKDFINQKVDPKEAYDISGFMMNENGFELSIEAGTLHFCTPVNGKSIVAVFSGRGEFSYTPKPELEKGRLQRFYGTQTFSKKITLAAFVFNNEFATEIKRDFTKVTQEVTDDEKELLELIIDNNSYTDKYIISKKQILNRNIAKAFLNDQKNMFTEVFATEDNEKVYMYANDPFDNTPISFNQIENNGGTQKSIDVVCMTYTDDQYNTNNTDSLDFTNLDVETYQIDAKLNEENILDGYTKVKCKLKNNLSYWLPFVISPELKVSEVKINGKATNFSQQKDYMFAWVKIDNSIPVGESFNVEFKYKGKFITKFWFVWDSYSFISKSQSPEWYPEFSNTDVASFNVTIEYPSNAHILCYGDVVDESTNGLTSRIHWREPNRFGSIVFDYYHKENKEYISGRNIPININYNHKATSLYDAYTKEVLSAIDTSICFYSNLFGECPVKKLTITQSELSNSTTPEHICLPQDVFSSTEISDEGRTAQVAVQMQFQWLGLINTNIKNDEQWLYKSIFTYLPGMFMQLQIKKPGILYSSLLTGKKYIFEVQEDLKDEGKTFGPVVLGDRNPTSAFDVNESSINSFRALWAIHMLRYLLIDVNDLKNETAFMGILKDFYTENKKGIVTNETFRKIVESHTNYDMSWFFKEWVYGNDIPSYKYSYNVERMQDSRAKVTMRVKQQNVDSNFVMFVPILIKFYDKSYVRLRTLIKGNECVFELPPLPSAPEEIIFNDLESVLCTVEQESWKD